MQGMVGGVVMDAKITVCKTSNITKLTDKDKITITRNLDICTDFHGKGCTILIDHKSKEFK